MSDARCSLCGELFPIWLDEAPALASCLRGAGTSLCAEALATARSDAMRRKVCPDAFDADGQMLPGHWPALVYAMHAVGLDALTGLPRTWRNEALPERGE
jgi:hypothetical protein